MSRVDEEKLILLVSTYPELYDTKHKDYSDVIRRNNIWAEISEELNVEANVCKEKWNTLRGCYRRSLKRKDIRFGLGFKKSKKWRFEDEMKFLETHLQEKGTASPEDTCDSEFDVVNEFRNNDFKLSDAQKFSEDFLEINSRHSASSDADATWASNQNSVATGKDDCDPITQFFLAMAETVKTLPPLMQARIKSEVFNSINSAELNYLQQKERNFNSTVT